MEESPLKIGFLVYRGNPTCGGQGVYTRYLVKELIDLGQQVEVFSGPPYPNLFPGSKLNKVPSLDLYRQPDPFRRPKVSEFKSLIDCYEYLYMLSGGFPEPLTFSLRARKLLKSRVDEFDIIHDNQCLGFGLIGMMNDGHNLVGTIHHPITVDRELDLMHAKSFLKKASTYRWYGFLRMQKYVAKRLQKIVTVSESSLSDISEVFSVDRSRFKVVPVGVDQEIFRPIPSIVKEEGNIITTASSDVPMKGLVPLLEAIAKLRTEVPVKLTVIGSLKIHSKIPDVLNKLNLNESVTFKTSLSEEEIVQLYARAQIAVVPSLYEGFSLPAIEAMACGVPLVATTGGAIPEVVGPDGLAALHVEPNNPEDLKQKILTLMTDPNLRKKLSEGAIARVKNRFTWRKCALGTLEAYRELLSEKANRVNG